MSGFGDQQTFSREHWEAVLYHFAGRVDVETLGVLYRASYSDTFGADLRALIRELVSEEAAEGWEA